MCVGCLVRVGGVCPCDACREVHRQYQVAIPLRAEAGGPHGISHEEVHWTSQSLQRRLLVWRTRVPAAGPAGPWTHLGALVLEASPQGFSQGQVSISGGLLRVGKLVVAPTDNLMDRVYKHTGRHSEALCLIPVAHRDFPILLDFGVGPPPAVVLPPSPVPPPDAFMATCHPHGRGAD